MPRWHVSGSLNDGTLYVSWGTVAAATASTATPEVAHSFIPAGGAVPHDGIHEPHKSLILVDDPVVGVRLVPVHSQGHHLLPLDGAITVSAVFAGMAAYKRWRDST